jgi:hypothetical protein
MSQKIELFVTTAVTTSNPTGKYCEFEVINEEVVHDLYIHKNCKG